MAGDECKECAKKKNVLQRKLAIGASNDPLEQEADRVADQVMAAPVNSAINAVPLKIQRFSGQANEGLNTAPSSVDRVLSSPGKPLESALRRDMEQRFGHDFSQVRVHTGSVAEQSARDVNAHAYTVGTNVVFGVGQFSPETRQGRKLIAHELTHVTQQSVAEEIRADQSIGKRSMSHLFTSTGNAIVQRAIRPEDVDVEMIGREFELAGAFTSGMIILAKGTRVKALTWVNADVTVSVLAPVTFGLFSMFMPVDIPKTLLRPVRPSGTKLAPYATGLSAQVKAVEKNEADLAGKTGAEKTRLEGLLARRREVLNRKLIQETMFNLFDPVIAREVAAANAAHGLTGADALDPDLVKSMIFQETEMGTSGTHLELPPSHPVKSRFNLGQVIDSSGIALLTMLEREQPALITAFFLTNLRSDLAAAKTEKVTLEKKTLLNATEIARLAELKRLSSASWETFIWGYKASGRPIGFSDAVNAFFASSRPAKNMDYEFWIHMMVLWLFEKKTPSRSWLDTIKAYNGSGKRAEHYRDAVSRRAASAEAAASAGTLFTPTR
jgi:hypothetical protein